MFCCVLMVLGFEGFSGSDEKRERGSDFENYEDERRKSVRILSFDED